MAEPIQVANIEEVLVPAPVVSPVEALVAQAEPATEVDGPKTFALVKNFKPREIITLPDGSEFSFGESALFVTTDERLYKALLSVADQYSICQQ